MAEMYSSPAIEPLRGDDGLPLMRATRSEYCWRKGTDLARKHVSVDMAGIVDFMVAQGVAEPVANSLRLDFLSQEEMSSWFPNNIQGASTPFYRFKRKLPAPHHIEYDNYVMLRVDSRMLTDNGLRDANRALCHEIGHCVLGPEFVGRQTLYRHLLATDVRPTLAGRAVTAWAKIKGEDPFLAAHARDKEENAVRMFEAQYAESFKPLSFRTDVTY